MKAFCGYADTNLGGSSGFWRYKKYSERLPNEESLRTLTKMIKSLETRKRVSGT
jgi:hypothetical protein